LKLFHFKVRAKISVSRQLITLHRYHTFVDYNPRYSLVKNFSHTHDIDRYHRNFRLSRLKRIFKLWEIKGYFTRVNVIKLLVQTPY